MQNIKIYAFADEVSSDINQQILAMKRNSLDGLEIRNVDGKNISEITAQKAKEVKTKLDDAGLDIWSIGSPIGKIHMDEGFAEHVEKFKYTLEIANILNAKNMRIFSFYMSDKVAKSKYKNEVIERMGCLVDIAKEFEVRLCHENEKGIYGDTAEACLQLYQALPELRGVFDPANFVQCQEDTLKAWEILKKYTKYIHIKDAGQDGTIVPAGYGSGNIKQIVTDYLNRNGHVFTMEPHLVMFEGLNSLEQKGEESKIEQFKYGDANASFDMACTTFKAILKEI